MKDRMVHKQFPNLQDAFCAVPAQCLLALHRAMELIRNDEQNVHVDVQSQETKLHTTYMDFDENNPF
ncbi:MAG: hypothetical protein IJ418_13750 [Clostridia bacterium]|nr:hypothetical protein [Clostridia bacterium]